jgi:erythrocyte band 7 integral membrane protein
VCWHRTYVLVILHRLIFPQINPFTERIDRIDVKIQIQEITRQIIMTKDNVNISLDAVLYWHIIDPYQAMFGVSDVTKCLIER